MQNIYLNGGIIFLTILLTRVHVQVHFSIQDVNPACNGLHRIMINSLCNDVTVPRYVLLPGSKKKTQVVTIKTSNKADLQ